MCLCQVSERYGFNMKLVGPVGHMGLSRELLRSHGVPGLGLEVARVGTAGVESFDSVAVAGRSVSGKVARLAAAGSVGK